MSFERERHGRARAPFFMPAAALAVGGIIVQAASGRVPFGDLTDA